jgi:hypothetical protein
LISDRLSHHCAAEGWGKRVFQLGIPAAIISAITSAAIFVDAAKDIWWVGVAAALSVIATILTTLNTFLNPSEKESAHLTAARAYDRLNNDALMF